VHTQVGDFQKGAALGVHSCNGRDHRMIPTGKPVRNRHVDLKQTRTYVLCKVDIGWRTPMLTVTGIVAESAGGRSAPAPLDAARGNPVTYVSITSAGMEAAPWLRTTRFDARTATT